MRIAIDLLIAEKEPGGMLFATRALLDGFAQIDEGHEYIIITSCPKEYQALIAGTHLQLYPVKLRFWRGILMQHQLLLPEALHRIKPDVLHVPAFAAPIGWHGPLVVTVHDLAFLTMPQQTSIYARLYWRYMLRESVRRAQQVIAVSEQTRSELVSSWAIDAERVQVVHNALRPSLRYGQIEQKEIQQLQQAYGVRYLLHVGRMMPRKNVETLIQAFDILAAHYPDLHLVLTGGAGHGSAEVVQQIETSHYYNRIHQVGWVSEHDMGALYAGATALVFPSLHEGFGLPTIEAMACGIPVIASYQAASQEIAGEAVYRADCSHATPLVAAIEEVLSNATLRTHLVQAGKEQARPFTSRACAQATNRVYEQAVAIKQTATGISTHLI